MKRKRLLLLLALLMTAATGAWAQDAAKHVITATYDKQTRLLEQPLPYETTVGALYEAVTGQSFNDFISFMSAAYELNLTGISSGSPSVVLIGDFNGASTKVKVNADGKATVALRFGNFAQGIYVSVVPPLYVTMADGTKDAAKWTATVGTNSNAQTLPVGELNEKDAVTLTYGGRLKVKSVTATHDGWDGDLSNIPASALEADGQTLIVPNGATLKGTLDVSTILYKVVIPDGATVTLDGVSINGVNSVNYMWAGITCLGDATIILSGTNTVKGFFKDYPGIQAAAAGKTLIINGTGSLTASSYGLGAGIGGKRDVACGDIEIQGGTITATSGSRGAGIGGGDNASCGNITISGGTVNATGGVRGAGIGGGRRGTSESDVSCGNILISGGTVTATGGAGAAGIGGGRGYNSDKLSSCGTITITNGVTRVTATKGENAPNSIGAGKDGTCGTVTIGGTKYWEDNAAVDNDAATYLAQATIEYPEPVTLATPLTIEAITAGTIQVNMNATLSTGMKYSKNGGTKTDITSTTTIEGLKAGDKVRFYSNGTGNTAYTIPDPKVNISGGTAEVKVYGNIMSLLDEERFATKTDLQNYAFFGLFLENTKLIDASELLLPAATLTASCYQQMFEGCTALTKAPKLPATWLETYCYYSMFSGCTSLTSAYVKAAYINVTAECDGMFGGCTATGATLHTTSGNKASWEGVMGTGNWTVADDWQD